jgi:16S rRNA (cytosine1402-N4)-methyltransferase
MTDQHWHHSPVLKEEVLKYFIFSNAKSIFDGTTGLGGHAEAILSDFDNIEKYIACDLDDSHLLFAKKRLNKWENKTIFINSNFSEIKKITQDLMPPRPLLILCDLGICSTHVDDEEKGFTFSKDTPLNMSYDQKSSSTCAEILNNEKEIKIFEILKNFGEEPNARKIAQKIVETRIEKPFKTTFDLREIIESSVPPQFRKKALARVFQAFRIAVNDELGHLQKLLNDGFEIMETGDRMGIMSYHSLEDRLVKNHFRNHSKPKTTETKFSLNEIIEKANFRLLTKKPITPTKEELKANPRSRSVKFRICEKI